MSPSPRLSIVVAARNDDHGGGFIRRMQMFVNGLLEQATRYRLNSELIIVEWNPPADRPRLADAVRWPASAGPCAVRIIEVPPAIHGRYSHSAGLGLFQMMAKNVGIRRSRGRFVLCTNADLLFSGELVRFLASGHLDARCMYRIDRLDVSPDAPIDAPLDDQLEFCRRHLVRVNGRRRISRADEIGWVGGLRRILGRPPTASVGAALRRARKRVTQRFMRLHTTACGDFTLLSRDVWVRLRGYPEWQMYSLHIDSILCYMAHHSGVREVVLKGGMRAYHVDHSSGWSPELGRRLQRMGVPILNDDQFCSYIRVMHARRSPTIFNDESWGLSTEALVETDPVTRRAEAPL